jgi:glucose/arabinose dehydrogenase
VNLTGEKRDLLVGLPSYGDHQNNRVTFGSDGMMYFGQGTATNSGVVGIDNPWVNAHSYFHDYPAKEIVITGQNFETENMIENNDERVETGAFSPFATPAKKGEKIRSILPGAGTIMRANEDGSNLEMVAWGFRNPYSLKFDQFDQLWVANLGMDDRGSRPIKNSPDDFTSIIYGNWYGWPDYTGGFPVTDPFFKPLTGPQPEFLLEEHPMTPKRPFVNFIPHSVITGFSFNRYPDFGFPGDAFIAEFGPNAPLTTGGEALPHVGHRVTRIDMKTGQLYAFVQNHANLPASKSLGVGLERPIDVVFGADHNMYILDYGILTIVNNQPTAKPNTGVIWKVSRSR